MRNYYDPFMDIHDHRMDHQSREIHQLRFRRTI